MLNYNGHSAWNRKYLTAKTRRRKDLQLEPNLNLYSPTAPLRLRG